MAYDDFWHCGSHNLNWADTLINFFWGKKTIYLDGIIDELDSLADNMICLIQALVWRVGIVSSLEQYCICGIWFC